MKRRFLNVLSVLIIASILVIPAFAATEVAHYEQDFSLAFNDTDPCTGHDSYVEFSGTAYIHEVSNDETGTFISTYRMRSKLTVTDMVTGEAYTAPVIWNFSEAGGLDGPATYVYNASITSPGPGNNVLLHVVMHFSPNGTFDVDNSDMVHICTDLPGS